MKVEATETENGFDSLFSVGRFLVLIGLLIFVSYPGPVLGSRTFCYRDAGLFSYPVAYYLRDSIWQGHWPLWNPYSHCGTPFLAQWNTLALYPLSLIYILLPMPWSLNLFLLGHLLLGGLGMYKLAHRWFGKRFAASVAGLAFAWNGLAIHCLMWPCHTGGLAWMPWVVWLCDRAAKDGGRRIYWAALAGACQMLTGSPETILLTWLIVAVVFVRDSLQTRGGFWPGSRRLVLAVILISALSAAQLLPCFNLLLHGDRTSTTGNGFWALTPWGLANFFVPLFHMSPSLSGVFMQDEQQWTSSYYIGILPLALASVAIWRARAAQTRVLAGLALAGILLALADAGFVLNILKRIVPLLGFIRFPVKFIILTTFCFALLAGAGVAWLQSQPIAVVSRNLRASAIWIGLAILVVLAVAYWFPFPTDSWAAVWPNALARLAFLLIGVALLTFALRVERLKTKPLVAFAFLLWMGLDVCAHMPPQNPTAPAQAYDAYVPLMTQLPQLGESRALLGAGVESTMDHLVNPDLLQLYLGQRSELFSDCNLLNRIPKVGGFMTLHLADAYNVIGLLKSGKAGPGLAQFLGVSQIAAPRQLFVWEAQTNFMPWASIGQNPIFLDTNATLFALGTPAFLPRKMVYLPSSARGQITAEADGQAQILSSRIEPSECVFETRTEKRTLLVMAQAWYPCWQASMDGASVPLWRANYAFQTLEVPPGRHHIRIEYVDRALQAGMAISVVALAVCIVFLSNGSRRIST